MKLPQIIVVNDDARSVTTVGSNYCLDHSILPPYQTHLARSDAVMFDLTVMLYMDQTWARESGLLWSRRNTNMWLKPGQINFAIWEAS